jgi:menaquinone-dependent protoporphyrinogen oxidase
MKVLVAYGTKNGSTGGIADMIAAELTTVGVAAQARPAAEVRSVDGYDAVVLGGALYAGRWHRDARGFARRYATALQGRPVWVFSSGPLDNSAEARDIPAVAQAARAGRQLNARQHVTFGGRLGEDARGFLARSMVRGGRGGDFRNPERIAAWAREIATALQPVSGASSAQPTDGGGSR